LPDGGWAGFVIKNLLAAALQGLSPGVRKGCPHRHSLDL